VLLEDRGDTAIIDVTFPQSSDRLRLSGVPLLPADDGRRGICFPEAV
jgi:hypothetical protein